MTAFTFTARSFKFLSWTLALNDTHRNELDDLCYLMDPAFESIADD